jgi:HPt (histidine-containing phosphotransfer) domain-containing protein
MTARSWMLPEELRQLADSGETGLVEEVLGVFQTDTAARVEDMRAASAAADRATLRTQAHALKGSSAQVGALALADICKTLEDTALHAPPPELAELVARIDREFQDVCRQMRQE